MKKALLVMCGVLLCSACGAPSLRYKYEVNELAAQGKFERAANLVESKRKHMYGKRDTLLYELDRASLLHDAGQYSQSDSLLADAQARITDSYTKSVSASASRVLINDLATPYYAADYETALTFFYRAMNFLNQKDVSSAGVEARKAVFFLDHLRGEKKKGYTDDPFVQYMASLIFESTGDVSDARIARQNALNAYQKRGWTAPHFAVPNHPENLGEVIIVHSVGQVPLKKSQTIQLAWHRILSFANMPVEDAGTVSPEVQNAISAGLMGSAITVAYPVLETQPYYITSSTVQIAGKRYAMQPMSYVSELVTQDLEEKLPGMWFRIATRAVLRRVAAVQARHAMERDRGKDNSFGWLAEMVVDVFGAAVEKADTRQWFTLPASIYMSRVFIEPGTQDIQLLLQDRHGNVLGTHTFEDIQVPRGGRVFLHYRSAY